MFSNTKNINPVRSHSPSYITETIQPIHTTLARSRRVEPPLARLKEQRLGIASLHRRLVVLLVGVYAARTLPASAESRRFVLVVLRRRG